MKARTAITVLSEVGQNLLGIRHGHHVLAKNANDLFFRRGWGDDAALKRLTSFDLIASPPQSIDIDWRDAPGAEVGARDGSFVTPMFEDLLPEESRLAHVRMYLPRDAGPTTPLCIFFPMTGDEGYRHRYAAYAKPLLKQGIGSVLLESPFYGARRPKGQSGYQVESVKDMLIMSAVAIEEGKSLLRYLSDSGRQTLGVAGVSQGGMVAAIVGSAYRQPLAIATSLAAHSPEVIFTEGLLRELVDWTVLNVASPSERTERFKTLFRTGDLTRLPPPFLPSAAFIQGAKRDLVVPKHSVLKHHEAWPGSSIHWLPGTHVSTLALHSAGFRKLVVRAFAALEAHSDATAI